jgi:plasmid stabilization system protein ParE
MKVVLSPAAESDLEEIGDYIAGDNPHRAISFIREIREHCLTIAAAPNAAPLREKILGGVRMMPHGDYLIFYRALNSEIRVERILHGARDIQRLMGE